MKKVLSLLMALIMAFSVVQCLSVVSFAAEADFGSVVKTGNCGEKMKVDELQMTLPISFMKTERL